MLQLDGANAYDEEEVLKRTGQKISRPRRWGKFFERMGIMYRDGQVSRLTDLGTFLAHSANKERTAFRLNVAKVVLSVLCKYQLSNPADDPNGRYPPGTDIFPYWCILKTADELDGRIHWDEVNRELMHILRMAELPDAIARIRTARTTPGYDPAKGGSETFSLHGRCHDESSAPAGKTVDGQVRDHSLTPWLKRCGFGELLLAPPGKGGGGYWSIPEDLRAVVKEALLHLPVYRVFTDSKDWMEFYGSLPDNEAVDFLTEEPLNDDDPIWLQVSQLLSGGSLAILLTGPPGTSKTWYAKRVALKIARSEGRVKQVQFHPSFSYDDFIEGYVPTSSPAGIASLALFEIIPKTFLSFCDLARRSPNETFVFVIDEVNRGDVSRIFGELMTYVERDYRDKSFTLSYSGKPTSIPRNVVLLGTMNPYDRSVVELDDALERRFDRISLEPSVEILAGLLEQGNVAGPLRQLIIDFFKKANGVMPNGIGHALFLSIRNEQDALKVWNHNLRFIFQKALKFNPVDYEELVVAFQPLVGDGKLLR
jgi:hypothetical protein